MSDFVRCKKCFEHGWVGSHRCFEYIIKIPEWDSDGEFPCWGVDRESAIEHLVEQMDDEHDLLDKKIEVHIANAHQDELVWRIFEVEAEAIVEYRAYEKDEHVTTTQ